MVIPEKKKTNIPLQIECTQLKGTTYHLKTNNNKVKPSINSGEDQYIVMRKYQLWHDQTLDILLLSFSRP